MADVGRSAHFRGCSTVLMLFVHTEEMSGGAAGGNIEDLVQAESGGGRRESTSYICDGP
jgi:hypothetical protein